MRKLLVVLLSSLSLTALAQVPDWYDDGQRAMSYPKSKYFTGIVVDNVQRNENVGTALERVKAAARVEALQTIRVHVQNETTSNTHSESIETIDDWAETVRETLDSKTTTIVDLDIPGLQVEAWKDPNSNEIAAFAYIKKATLSRQMDKQVTAGLTRIETVLDNVDQFVSGGQKVQARDAIQKAIPFFQEVEQAQRILIVADPLSDAESLQLEETKALLQRYTRLVAELKNGINIYLVSHAFLFGNSYPVLDSQIKGCLSDLGCDFVRALDKADWDISVIAKPYSLKQVTENSFFCRLNTTIKIINRMTGQCIYEARVYNDAGLDVKGGSFTSDDDAAVDAYKNLTPIICDIIKQQITR